MIFLWFTMIILSGLDNICDCKIFCDLYRLIDRFSLFFYVVVVYGWAGVGKSGQEILCRPVVYMSWPGLGTPAKSNV